MMLRRIRCAVLIGAVGIAFALMSAPARGQMVVYDPSNYAQNVLQAARALQQINNQVTSLQNQTQMLINQAKNLAALPFSSSLQLEQSIQRTQQLLAQAQRIAYDIQQIDREFSTTYAPASSSLSDQTLIANAHRSGVPTRLSTGSSSPASTKSRKRCRQWLDVPAIPKASTASSGTSAAAPFKSRFAIAAITAS